MKNPKFDESIVDRVLQELKKNPVYALILEAEESNIVFSKPNIFYMAFERKPIDRTVLYVLKTCYKHNFIKDWKTHYKEMQKKFVTLYNEFSTKEKNHEN